VTVEGAPQTSGVSAHDFSQPVYYKVVSKDGMYTRLYRVEVEFVNADDSRPRLNGFLFDTADNAALASGTSGMIDHGAGLVIIEAVYSGDPPPYTLVPRFSAGGNVTVNGALQTSGASAVNFSGKVKYTVTDPGNPSLFRDYWVEVRFVKNSLSLAEIGEFRFFAADNPHLTSDVTAVIDQAAGTMYAVLAFDNAGNGHRTLVPRWLAQGTVQVGGVLQTSGASGRVFSPPVVYRAVSADGAFYRDYTVTVLEVNTLIYVKKNAAGDNTGVSWENAFTSLADACKAANFLPAALPAEIWIAEGTYRPSETRDRTAYFPVRGATGYYGGFAGTETSRAERVPSAHPVVISGDLGGGVYAEHLFMNTTLGGANVAFGEMTCTGARALTGSNQYGAAVFVSGTGVLAVTNVDFKDLRATNYGGAVYAFSSSGSITITNCGFKNITAGSSGGAVYASGNSGNVTITNCDFENITAGSNGGAVNASGNSVTITNCDFKNTTVTAGNYGYGFGGAVYASGNNASVTITDCGFENTKAMGNYGYGGAVYASGNTSSVTIKDCGFKNITASGGASGGGGGAVSIGYSSGGGIIVTIKDCGFENITAGGYGGAVYASGNMSSVTITDCDFKNVTAGNGGGAVQANGNVTITGCDFENITALGGGGAVYASGSSDSIAITDCNFKDTTAGTGGAVYASGSNITITGVSIVNSTATHIVGGGGLFVGMNDGGTLAIHNYTSTHTRTTGGGGSIGIQVSNGASVTINGASISDSEAVNTTATGNWGGGGIEILGGGLGPVSTVVFSNVTLTNVRAQGSGHIVGGAVYFDRIALAMNNCSIVSSASGGYGGAVAGSSSSSCVFNGVSFQGFSAPLGGSLLYGNTGTYSVGPGCYINGTPVNASTFASFLPLCYLVNGATIAPAF
jgi:hypothetical protein